MYGPPSASNQQGSQRSFQGFPAAPVPISRPANQPHQNQVQHFPQYNPQPNDQAFMNFTFQNPATLNSQTVTPQSAQLQTGGAGFDRIPTQTKPSAPLPQMHYQQTNILGSLMDEYISEKNQQHAEAISPAKVADEQKSGTFNQATVAQSPSQTFADNFSTGGPYEFKQATEFSPEPIKPAGQMEPAPTNAEAMRTVQQVERTMNDGLTKMNAWNPEAVNTKTQFETSKLSVNVTKNSISNTRSQSEVAANVISDAGKGLRNVDAAAAHSLEKLLETAQCLTAAITQKVDKAGQPMSEETVKKIESFVSKSLEGVTAELQRVQQSCVESANGLKAEVKMLEEKMNALSAGTNQLMETISYYINEISQLSYRRAELKGQIAMVANTNEMLASYAQSLNANAQLLCDEVHTLEHQCASAQEQAKRPPVIQEPAPAVVKQEQKPPLPPPISVPAPQEEHEPAYDPFAEFDAAWDSTPMTDKVIAETEKEQKGSEHSHNLAVEETEQQDNPGPSFTVSPGFNPFDDDDDDAPAQAPQTTEDPFSAFDTDTFTVKGFDNASETPQVPAADFDAFGPVEGFDTFDLKLNTEGFDE